MPFVGLMVLLRHLSVQTMSYIALLIPFGALGLGALIESEPLTAQAIIGAALVGAGLLVAQGRRERSEAAATADQREHAPPDAPGLAAPVAGERAIAGP